MRQVFIVGSIKFTLTLSKLKMVLRALIYRLILYAILARPTIVCQRL